MDKIILIRAAAVLFGLCLIFYIGLYYCGWDAITDLIDYANCNWDCVEKREIAWGIFRIFPLFETFVGLGVWVIIFGVIKP